MDQETCVTKVSETITNFPGHARRRWFGQKLIAEQGIDPNTVARILLSETYEGRLATEVCFGVAESVAAKTELKLSWKESWASGS